MVTVAVDTPIILVSWLATHLSSEPTRPTAFLQVEIFETSTESPLMKIDFRLEHVQNAAESPRAVPMTQSGELFDCYVLYIWQAFLPFFDLLRYHLNYFCRYVHVSLNR